MNTQRWVVRLAAVGLIASFGIKARAGQGVAEQQILWDHAHSRAVLAGDPMNLEIIKLDGTKLRTLPLDSPAVEWALSTDGEHLAVSLQKGGLIIVELATGNRRSLETQGLATSLSWAPRVGTVYYGIRAPDGTLEARSADARTGPATTVMRSGHRPSRIRAGSEIETPAFVPPVTQTLPGQVPPPAPVPRAEPARPVPTKTPPLPDKL